LLKSCKGPWYTYRIAFTVAVKLVYLKKLKTFRFHCR